MRVTCTPLGMFHIKDELEGLFPNLILNFTKGIVEKSKTEELLMNEKYVVIGSETLGADFLNKTKLKMIVRFGGSLENIDLDAAKKNNIKVINYKSATVSNDVANLTVGFVIDAAYSCARLILANKSGEWRRPMVQGSNACISVFGSGQIGKLVTKKLENIGFTYVNNISMQKILSTDNYYNDLEKVFIDSDIVVLNSSYLSWDKSAFNKLLANSDNISLVNTARGNLLNESTILECLNNGSLKNYYSDVTSSEPPNNHSQSLISHKNAYITPHIGGYSKKSLIEVGTGVLEYFTRDLND